MSSERAHRDRESIRMSGLLGSEAGIEHLAFLWRKRILEIENFGGRKRALKRHSQE